MFFGARGTLKGRKFSKLVQKGVATPEAVDAYVAKHLASAGKTLPKYSWGLGGDGAVPVLKNLDEVLDNLSRKGFQRNKVSDGLVKLINVIKGPTYNPILDHVYIGKKVNPKVLLHELGHAQDFRERGLAGLLDSKDGFRGALRNIFKPDKSKTVQREMRAWDNAGIAAGDSLREAALDTYRNQAQALPFLVASAPATYAGAYWYGLGRQWEKQLGSKD